MLNQRFTATNENRAGMSRGSLVLGGVLWSAVAAGLLFAWQGKQPDPPAEERTEQTGSSVKLGFPARELPDFELDEVMGGKLGLEDLKGKRWVASFVFSRCTTSCPMISAAMMKLHDRVEETAPDILFVSFTVDPKHDTVDVFRQYSEIFTRGRHERWKFLTGSQQEIYELIVKGFGLVVRENPPETRLPGLEVAHTNRVVLVNEEGTPVGTFLGTNEADMVKLRRYLTGRDEFPKPGPGLTFSSPDGTPLPVQFSVKPIESDDDSDVQNRSEESEVPANQEQDDDNVNSETSSTEQNEPVESNSVEAHNALIDEKLPSWARVLPTYNAGLNSLATVLLLSGFAAIKNGKKELHRNLMIVAFLTSAAFLACYLTYHYALGEYTGEHGKRFAGGGMSAVIYNCILVPHIVLAVFVPILAIQVFRHAFAARWEAHRRLAKITFPIWMFVSVTGVVIYAMLYHWPVAATS